MCVHRPTPLQSVREDNFFPLQGRKEQLYKRLFLIEYVLIFRKTWTHPTLGLVCGPHPCPFVWSLGSYDELG